LNKQPWDDYSSLFPFKNIVSVFSNKIYNVKNKVDLEIFSRSVKLNPYNLITLNQIHSSNIIVANNPGHYKSIDGVINFSGELVCSIQVADCLPIYFVNNSSKAIGLIHAGWRGLSKKIIEEILNKIILCNENLSDFYILIGPSIRSCCFEVGDDVIQFFDSNYYYKKNNKKYSVNLQKWALNQLISKGIDQNKIIEIQKCTSCLEASYHSYRRNNVIAGRMYALLGWEKNNEHI